MFIRTRIVLAVVTTFISCLYGKPAGRKIFKNKYNRKTMKDYLIKPNSNKIIDSLHTQSNLTLKANLQLLLSVGEGKAMWDSWSSSFPSGRSATGDEDAFEKCLCECFATGESNHGASALVSHSHHFCVTSSWGRCWSISYMKEPCALSWCLDSSKVIFFSQNLVMVDFWHHSLTQPSLTKA